MSEDPIKKAIAIQRRLKRLTYSRNGGNYSRALRKAINKNITWLQVFRKERKA